MKGLVTHSTIGTTAALGLVAAARDHAVAEGWKVAIAVADNAGNMMAFIRVDGAPAACITIARDKACTAANFGVSTREMAEGLAHEAPRVMAGLVACDGLAFFGGGVPVIINGETVGAVGVSGSSEAQDEACAIAAIDKVFGDRNTEI